MRRQSEDSQAENIDLQDSSAMNADQQAIFLNISRSKSADSFIGKLLPHLNDVPDRDRSLVWEPMQTMQNRTHNIIITHYQTNPQGNKIEQQQQRGGLRVFKKIKKQKVKSKCDYQKNICGYITKRVIREFISKSYEEEVSQLTRKYRCNYEDCKKYYLRKVEYVTGPSHLPQLLNPNPAADQPSTTGFKRTFREFYRWFLKQRYLRYLLLEGKMTNKQAYIQYKNTHLFKYVEEPVKIDEEQMMVRELQTCVRTRSRSLNNVQERDGMI